MSEADRQFHEQWLGMAQPAQGLVVSVPVLVDAQCREKLPREAHLRFLEELVEDEGRQRLQDLPRLLERVLDLHSHRFHTAESIPQAVSLYVPEGRQLLRPTRALNWPRSPEPPVGADGTPAAMAACPYAMLVWEVPPEVRSLDQGETVTGTWEYPAQAKFERLLRECRVPIGLLTNGWELRLVYAPHGESSGWLAFRVDDMASVSGRPIFDAFVMLLGRHRWFGVAPGQQLPSILAESRKRNVDVTHELSRQVFEGLEVLLAGFAAAEERDGAGLLREALERDDDHLYAGLLAVLLRMVFLLYCEDRALLPVEHELFARNYSLLGLFDRLQEDNGKYPDTMHRRFGAYPQLVSLFRMVFLGVKHGDLDVPARRGELFDPNAYPFLEGWGPDGSAPTVLPEDGAWVRVPTVDDLTVLTVLRKLLYLDGQRLSYRALDVEQIGSVYEALMGFDVVRLTHGAVRIRLGTKKGAARVWVDAERLLAVPQVQRQRWLEGELGFEKNAAAKIVVAVGEARSPDQALTALEPLCGRNPERAMAGTLVIQPGLERRRTSSHYTPRELTEPIVAHTLEPLIRKMGEEPASETLLGLVICDPAMGSGAFLVAACRNLADHVVAAWTREGKVEGVADAHQDTVNHARRLVAQRCLYGVDKNRYAVQLARLSLWLVTTARNEPFTFVDHALRHGDSLVGLSFDQIEAFHWKPGQHVGLSAGLWQDALAEAIGLRQRIRELAGQGTWTAQREKERLLVDAEDALDRVRLVGDLVVGAFFAGSKNKARQQERDRRLDRVERWLGAEKGGDTITAAEVEAELRNLQAKLRKTQVPFHWMLEFPEVFHAERPDPLDCGGRNGAAHFDAIVGNPPFLGGRRVSFEQGEAYAQWLGVLHDTGGNADLCVHFLRRSAHLLGARGVFGLVATRTVSEGDSRASGLGVLLGDGWCIYDATSSKAWPGPVAVFVAIIHASRGLGALRERRVLDGQAVVSIDSRLLPGVERPEPKRLATNQGQSFQGSIPYGMGFTLLPSERESLVQRDSRNSSRILPYLGGEEVNASPDQSCRRFVIDFGQLELHEAGRWPDLVQVLRERVKPEREGTKATQGYPWWRFWRPRDELYAAIANLKECLVTNAQASKHLVFVFVATGAVFANSLNIFPFDRRAGFAILQSRIHGAWSWRLSSSLGTGIRYNPSDCFETFPFPQSNPRAMIPELEIMGGRLHEIRARFMVETGQGLTSTYNALKDPICVDSRILELRRLHEDMDRAVLAAFSWSDLEVPPYCPATHAERVALQGFEDTVIDRLFHLNAQRASVVRKNWRRCANRSSVAGSCSR
ncbi:Eco57I restriction-modification methylase domain-containing protein [Myxococcota bacterium]